MKVFPSWWKSVDSINKKPNQVSSKVSQKYDLEESRVCWPGVVGEILICNLVIAIMNAIHSFFLAQRKLMTNKLRYYVTHLTSRSYPDCSHSCQPLTFQTAELQIVCSKYFICQQVWCKLFATWVDHWAPTLEVVGLSTTVFKSFFFTRTHHCN